MTESFEAPARTLALEEQHRELGAALVEVEGVAIPLHYGSWEGEYEALRRGCGWIDRSWGDRLELVGADRARFLHGLVTCQVERLEAGAGAYGFFTNVEGRILSDVVVLVHQDRLWLELPAGHGPTIEAHLRKYIVADRVEILPLDDMLPLVVAGPAIGDWLRHAGVSMPASRWGHGRVRIGGTEVHLSRQERAGVPAVTLWVSEALAAPVLDSMLALEAPPLIPVGHQAWETLRIEAGVPRCGLDFTAANFPQETDIEEAVDFDKGCYLGQEVVARIHFRGGVNRHLRGLRFEGETAPAPGALLEYEGREVGVAHSVASSPLMGCPAGLAVLHRRALASGTRLVVAGDGRQARVCNLPFSGDT
jgi:folate-binding protein YgfZ